MVDLPKLRSEERMDKTVAELYQSLVKKSRDSIDLGSEPFLLLTALVAAYDDYDDLPPIALWLRYLEPF